MTKEDLKIVFFGTPEFAVDSLKALVEGGFNVAAVVTATDKPAGRGHHLLQSDVKKYALETGLPILQPEKLKDAEFVEKLREINADLFIVIAFRMLPEVVWQMPRLGTFNLHASLLPKYRGAAPINWAVINGDTETGVTTFFLKHEIDTGDIIAQERIAIAPDDNVGVVYDKLMRIGSRLTIDTVESIIRGDLKTTPQDEILKGKEPTPAPKIFKDTCRIDWNKNATDINNLIRGLSPYPAAWSELDGQPFKITKAIVTAIDGFEPGHIKIDKNRLLVGTGSTALELVQIQPSGKKSMPASDYLRGARLNEEAQFS